MGGQPYTPPVTEETPLSLDPGQSEGTPLPAETSTETPPNPAAEAATDAPAAADNPTE